MKIRLHFSKCVFVGFGARHRAGGDADSYVLANSLILRQSAEMPLSEVLGANFVLAGLIGIAAVFTIIVLTAPTRSTGYFDLLVAAAAIIASSVMTSHSMARLDYRAPLVAFTALHQAANRCLAWRSPYLLIAIRRAPTPEFARRLSARFRNSRCECRVLASAGFVLSVAYVVHSRPSMNFLRRDGRY